MDSISGWSPESHPNDQDTSAYRHSCIEEVVKRGNRFKLQEEKGGYVQPEKRRGDTSNQRNNTGESASVLLDVSVMELDQEDNEDQELLNGPLVLTATLPLTSSTKRGEITAANCQVSSPDKKGGG